MSAATATAASLTTPETPARLGWQRLLGTDPVVRQQVQGVLFSTATYLVYGGIIVAQVALGLLATGVAWALFAAGMGANAVFYALVRSGHHARGRDPGLGRTQLVVGIAFMFAGYASLGPAATGLLVVMASHVVYSMFSMTPRQVWRLVAGLLAGLVATMGACHVLWPERYVPAVQASGLLYSLLVLPLIALLAHRVTAMTQRLTAQHTELQAALGRLSELATRDELTRTHNRRHMGELMRAQQSQATRLGTPLALALIDIDHFKRVNDGHGHAVGDEVLRLFAEVARASLRASDLLGRWGGEEFLVLLPHTGLDEAEATLARLQQRLADAAAYPALPPGLQLSFSAGLTLVAPGESPDAAVERADQAMYRAKTLGRCRCERG